jgi:predicted O-linked N-acetylglucosamine transferase (SPINDLY family)
MPTLAEAFQIAIQHHQAGRFDVAAEIYRRILQADPRHSDSLVNLGNLLYGMGQLFDATACFRRAIDAKPDCVEAYSNLGSCLQAQQQFDEAMACFQHALALRPDYPETLNNMGNALHSRGRVQEAVACYQRAIQVKPDFAFAHNNLGDVWREQRQFDQAVACYHRAMQLSPATASIWNNCGAAMRDQGKGIEAMAYFRHALELQPDYAAALNNLGNCWKDQGELDEAIACYRRAVELKPDFAVAHSNLLYTLYYSPASDAQVFAEEHRRWNRQHALPLAPARKPHPNDRSPDRRLRIGYVSADLYGHPVGLFVLPLLEAHDHVGFEIFAYSSVKLPDEITASCRAHSDTWREVNRMTDEQLAEQIRQDQIDILVDLSMHTAGNRLLAFARKPAPVQVAYLAYPGTTGLDTMDYRLTDPYLDPPGADESYYAEQSIRLPETFWCYRPATLTPPLAALPASTAGHVTFGCLNNFCKATAPTAAAWARLLAAVPRSRLLLHSRPGSHRDRLQTTLAAAGIAPERLNLVDLLPTADYFQNYQQIDVALDPFPYGGGTTTCDALWMGVPVVSLAGRTAVGRGGRSILSNIGMAELVAADVDQYVAIAARLAGDLPRLMELRATLRDRMQHSPLMDTQRQARNLESAYRTMWQRWCAG